MLHIFTPVVSVMLIEKIFFFSFYRNGCLGNENVHRGHGQQRQIVKECIFF